MKGYIPVDIPTKLYVKAYVLHQLGEKPIMDTRNAIGGKLYDLLQHSTNERKYRYGNIHYVVTMRIYISCFVFRQRGANLNETNIKNLNIFIEALLKQEFHRLMDAAIDVLPSFENNLPEIRKRLGIDIEAWSDDSMRKDYYRYRKRTGKSPFYRKNCMPSVPSGRADNAAF